MKRVWTTLKWTAARTVLRTVGRASRGIRIGYRFGFDSGVMLDHVYENRARGVLGVGRLHRPGLPGRRRLAGDPGPS